MTKLDIYLAIADQGLGTAVLLLESSATEKESQAAKAKTTKEKTALLSGAKKDRALAKALSAAEAGIATYLKG